MCCLTLLLRAHDYWFAQGPDIRDYWGSLVLHMAFCEGAGFELKRQASAKATFGTDAMKARFEPSLAWV